jgi:hypothetical protein
MELQQDGQMGVTTADDDKMAGHTGLPTVSRKERFYIIHEVSLSDSSIKKALNPLDYITDQHLPEMITEAFCPIEYGNRSIGFPRGRNHLRRLFCHRLRMHACGAGIFKERNACRAPSPASSGRILLDQDGIADKIRNTIFHPLYESHGRCVNKSALTMEGLYTVDQLGPHDHTGNINAVPPVFEPHHILLAYFKPPVDPERGATNAYIDDVSKRGPVQPANQPTTIGLESPVLPPFRDHQTPCDPADSFFILEAVISQR